LTNFVCVYGLRRMLHVREKKCKSLFYHVKMCNFYFGGGGSPKFHNFFGDGPIKLWNFEQLPSFKIEVTCFHIVLHDHCTPKKKLWDESPLIRLINMSFIIGTQTLVKVYVQNGDEQSQEYKFYSSNEMGKHGPKMHLIMCTQNISPHHNFSNLLCPKMLNCVVYRWTKG
jgi:hypothetical protein